MEESAPKRRRTSPRTSVSLSPAATPEPRESTQRRKRPSFASPTKASLARHNPDILERRKSGSPQKGAAAGPSSRRQSDAASEQSLSDLLTAQLESVGDVASEDNAQERAEEEPLSPSGRMRGARGGLSAPARRSPSKPKPLPNPRPLPPRGPDADDEFNPFLGRSLRRSPTAGGAPAVAEPEPQTRPEPEPGPEPELPPSVPDPVSSTPPKGIHTSPSRWRRKSKQDSPLKKPPQRPAVKPKPVPSAIVDARPESRDPEPPVAETTALIRRTRSFNPDAKKKKERDALKEEIQRLKKDLEIARKENERIRLMQQSGRILAPSDQDEVLDLIRRQHGDSGSQAKPTSTQQLLQAALNPSRLLPFGKPLLLTGPETDDPEKLSDIKSHHPVLMTAKEELPYLELFSPFTVISKISMLPPQPKRPLRQLHSITLRSREMPGIFTARIDMIVNALNLTVLDLKIPALEPAARPELGPFIEKLCAGDCNRSLQQNVGVACWAMGEWVRVATERASFWHELESGLGSEEAIIESVRRVRAKKSKRKQDGDDELDAALSKDKRPLKRADLIRLIGQQHYDIAIPRSADPESTASVRLEWKTEFDWTGEAQSKLAVMIGTPGKCEFKQRHQWLIY